jgi:hypothetical protein
MNLRVLLGFPFILCGYVLCLLHRSSDIVEDRKPKPEKKKKRAALKRKGYSIWRRKKGTWQKNTGGMQRGSRGRKGGEVKANHRASWA